MSSTDLLTLMSISMDSTYLTSLICVSEVFIAYYGYKYRNHDKNLSHMLLALVFLGVWNIVLVSGGSKLVLSLEWVSPSVVKDSVYAAVIVVSLLLIHALAIGMLKYIDYLNQLPVVDLEKAQNHHAHSKQKSVSFDNNLTIPDGRSTYTTLLIPKIYNHHFQKSRLVVFFLILACSIVFYPKSCFLNSTSFIINNDFITFKFDQIYFSLIASFTSDSVLNVIRVVHYHQAFETSMAPNCLSIITILIWSYLSVVLTGSLYFIIMINDILLNIWTKNLSSSMTLIFFDYFNHALSKEDFINSFGALYGSLVSCWIVLSTICFIVFPVLIWIVLNLKSSHRVN